MLNLSPLKSLSLIHHLSLHIKCYFCQDVNLIVAAMITSRHNYWYVTTHFLSNIAVIIVLKCSQACNYSAFDLKSLLSRYVWNRIAPFLARSLHNWCYRGSNLVPPLSSCFLKKKTVHIFNVLGPTSDIKYVIHNLVSNENRTKQIQHKPGKILRVPLLDLTE